MLRNILSLFFIVKGFFLIYYFFFGGRGGVTDIFSNANNMRWTDPDCRDTCILTSQNTLSRPIHQPSLYKLSH